MRSNNLYQSRLAFLLKFLNFLQTFVGFSIIIYSVWMLNQWKRHNPIPQPPAPSPESSLDMFRVSGQDLPLNLAVNMVSGLEDGLGFGLKTLPSPWFIYSFLVDHQWEKDLPCDPTGELASLRAFIEENFDICKWIGITVVIIQALSLLLSMILRAVVSTRRGKDDSSDDDCTIIRGRTWQPLLHPHSIPTAGSSLADGKAVHSDIWSNRMREKYGLNSGDIKYNLLDQNLNANSNTGSEDRGGCSIL